MIAFAKRRLIGTSTVVGLVLLLLLLQNVWSNNLIDTSLYTGLFLITLIFFLICLNFRKQFSFLPIGRVSTWLQVHIYVAWFTIALFGVHIGFRVPRGGMEIALATIFTIVCLSGIGGLILSRLIPRFLTDRGGNIAFDEIPHLRRKLKREAEDLVVQSVEISKLATIADFYVDRVEVFFIGSKRALFNHLIGSNRHLEPILNRMAALRRYLNAEEIKVTERLEQLIIEKDNLDYQYSLLFLLKVWLFIHVPLSYGLLVLGAVHGFLAYRFVGG